MDQDTTTAKFWQTYEQLKNIELHKNSLIEEVLYRYTYLSETHKKECEDHEREREYNRLTQRHMKELGDKLKNVENLMNRDPFVLLLLDGDGMIFRDDLLREGEVGGKKAAGLLQEAVHNYVHTIFPNLATTSFKIVTRIYANIKGLGETCYRAGIVNAPSEFEDFMRGFNRGKLLFGYEDVGSGKERADRKVTEHFKLHLNDPRCKQIFLGCSHDNGYAGFLEELATDKAYVDRITLLEGVPFEKEFAVLPFSTHKLGDLFRETKINIYQTQQYATNTTPFPALGTPSANANGSTTAAALRAMPRTNSTSTIASADIFSPTTGKENAPALTWASTASKAASLPAPLTPTPAHAKLAQRTATTPTTIPRNRRGQRIDPLPATTYDKDEVARVKKLKMCNVHFLRHECPFGEGCTHVHRYKPTPAELETLKLVARMAPCLHGTGCGDAKCIYGHRCPFPVVAVGGGVGRDGKNCINGAECRFPVEMHNMDTEVVRVTKV